MEQIHLEQDKPQPCSTEPILLFTFIYFKNYATTFYLSLGLLLLTCFPHTRIKQKGMSRFNVAFVSTCFVIICSCSSYFT